MYLSPFIPGLSTLTAPMHKLHKKDAEFNWNDSYQEAFQHVTDTVIGNATLQYFNASHPITVQVDASQVWLGAALCQDNKPFAFANKALTEVECHYTSIECGMLAVIFRAEWLRTYIYGRSSIIESDHKPLELITQKYLANTPSQLQYMLLCLQGCDYILCYCPGKEIVLQDTLSHFKSKHDPEIALDITIYHACSPRYTLTLQVQTWPWDCIGYHHLPCLLSKIHSHTSSPNMTPRLHWISPSTILACPLSERKPSNWLLRWMLIWMPWLTLPYSASLMTSRKSHVHFIPTGNTVNHSLLKMVLCSVEKSLSSLH